MSDEIEDGTTRMSQDTVRQLRSARLDPIASGMSARRAACHPASAPNCAAIESPRARCRRSLWRLLTEPESGRWHRRRGAPNREMAERAFALRRPGTWRSRRSVKGRPVPSAKPSPRRWGAAYAEARFVRLLRSRGLADVSASRRAKSCAGARRGGVGLAARIQLPVSSVRPCRRVRHARRRRCVAPTPSPATTSQPLGRTKGPAATEI